MALILGIESSCDDTGVALYDSDQQIIIAELLASQTQMQKDYGGVVPELASRDHLKMITPLLNELCTMANCKLKQIDAIAYTKGPGLNGALLVGAAVANSLAFALNIPIIPIHHLEGHLLSPLLAEAKPSFPFLALLVSGGNTLIAVVEALGKYQILGETLDDAAGEAFDKTARMLGLPYPGGAEIAKLALNGSEIYRLPRPLSNSNDLNFSFSGLKTAVATLINRLSGGDDSQLSQSDRQNIAKSIEEAITDSLVNKVEKALEQTGLTNLVVSGGVSANLTLRDKLDKLGVNTFYPPLKHCTDNGAMIALCGALRLKLGQFSYNFTVLPRWQLMEYNQCNT